VPNPRHRLSPRLCVHPWNARWRSLCVFNSSTGMILTCGACRADDFDENDQWCTSPLPTRFSIPHRGMPGLTKQAQGPFKDPGTRSDQSQFLTNMSTALRTPLILDHRFSGVMLKELDDY